LYDEYRVTRGSGPLGCAGIDARDVVAAAELLEADLLLNDERLEADPLLNDERLPNELWRWLSLDCDGAYAPLPLLNDPALPL
jgi:hypothetical protein